jgi:hypothetical protein
MSTGVYISLGPLQLLLALSMQRTISAVSVGVGLGAPRQRLVSEPDASMPESLLRESDMGRPDFVRRILVRLNSPLGSIEDTTFSVTGVVMRDVKLQSANPRNQVPFQINLLDSTSPTGLLRSSEQFSIGVEVACTVDVRLQTTDGLIDPALVRIETKWLIGHDPDDPWSLSATPRTPAEPFETRFYTNTTAVRGVLLPNPCVYEPPNGSPLCAVAFTMKNIVRDALQAALRDLPRTMQPLAGLLPNSGRPINQGIYVTGNAVGFGPSMPSDQLHYVADLRWSIPGRVPITTNAQTRSKWRSLMTTRPPLSMNPFKDLVAYTRTSDLAVAMTPSLRIGVEASLSSIELRLWKELYFGSPRPLRVDERVNAELVMLRFRGDPDAAPGTWLDRIPFPWRAAVEMTAAVHRNTAFLAGRGTAPDRATLVAAFDILEVRLLSMLAEQFEGLPLSPIVSNTDPASSVPSNRDIAWSFINTRLPSLHSPSIGGSIVGSSGSFRDAYDEVKQARTILRAGGGAVGSPTATERAVARRHLRSVLTNCAGYGSILGRNFSTGQPHNLNPPGMSPRVVPADDPINRVDTIAADRAQDIANRALERALLDWRKRIPADLRSRAKLNCPFHVASSRGLMT